MTRRGFFFRLFGLLGLGGALGLLARRRHDEPATVSAGVVDRAVLVAVADTIVPDDEDPGAVRAGVPEAIQRYVHRTPWMAKHYARGVEALDKVARQDAGSGFAQLDLAARTRLFAELLDRANPGRVRATARGFVLLARRDVIRFFYASAGGQAMLDYRPPRLGYLEEPEPAVGSMHG
jgi:hypothetical protein